MAKNIKDIVDEGFAKLATLAEKRMEILERCKQITGAASGPQYSAAEGKIRNSETAYIAEINTQVEHLLSDLRQTLAQVAENNQFFQGCTREKLSMHVSGVLAELQHEKEHSLRGATDRLNSLLLQTDKESLSLQHSVSAEASKQLTELDSQCLRAMASQAESQADISSKIAFNQNQLNELLLETCNSLIQEAEKKRQKSLAKVEKFARSQSEELAKIAGDLQKIVDSVAAKSLEEMKDTCIQTEKDLDKKRDTILSHAVSELKSASKDSLSQLEDSYEYSRKTLSERLTGLLDLTKQLLQQEQQSLSNLDNTARSNADTICTELRNAGADDGAGKRNPVEDAFAGISDEMNDAADDLNRKVKELLKAQADAMAKLCTAAEKSYLDLFSDFMNEIKENMKVHDQLCSQKEEELIKQLEKLEKQIKATREQLNGGAR